MSYSVEVHRRFQNDTHILGCVIKENIENYWNVDGEKDLSDAWTGFTRFILEFKSDQKGSPGAGRDLQENNQRLVQTMYGQICGSMSDAAKEESKTKMGYRETKARQCQTIDRNILH